MGQLGRKDKISNRYVNILFEPKVFKTNQYFVNRYELLDT